MTLTIVDLTTKTYIELLPQDMPIKIPFSGFDLHYFNAKKLPFIDSSYLEDDFICAVSVDNMIFPLEVIKV